MEQPISKNQVLTQISSEVQALLARAIPVINRKLVLYSEGSSVSIYYNELFGANDDSPSVKRAVEEIKKMYGTQGWNVRYHGSEPRDPDRYLQFS